MIGLLVIAIFVKNKSSPIRPTMRSTMNGYLLHVQGAERCQYQQFKKEIAMKRIIVLVSILLLLVPLTAVAQDFCQGNFDYDKDVDGSDASTFKGDFGRSALLDPCPPDGPAPVPKTWQTPSYEAYDDGWYHRGVSWGMRFTDNGNGTMTDTLTGLIWLKNANCWGALTWSQALTYAHGLVNGQCSLTDGSVAGDWRLPNVKEMASLIDYDYYRPAMHQWQSFNNVQSSYYWSSTTYDYDPDFAWYVGMLDGLVGYDFKSSLVYVWPVRGGHPY
jgi:hypothetical protein